SPTATRAEITHAYRTRLRAHHRPTAHGGRRRSTVPLSATSRSPSPTTAPTSTHSTSHHHRCGPTRCTGTNRCDSCRTTGAQPDSPAPPRRPKEPPTPAARLEPPA